MTHDTFTARGARIFQEPAEQTDAQGVTRISMGFELLEISQIVADRPKAAETIAAVLNKHSQMKAGQFAILPEADAPKDGRKVWILVDYAGGAHPLEDERYAWTIGFNTLRDTGEDEWLFVGWSWQQDLFTDGRGRVVGWCDAPIPAPPPPCFTTDAEGEE